MHFTKPNCWVWLQQPSSALYSKVLKMLIQECNDLQIVDFNIRNVGRYHSYDLLNLNKHYQTSSGSRGYYGTIQVHGK